MPLTASHEDEDQRTRELLEMLEHTDLASIERALQSASGAPDGILISLRGALSTRHAVAALGDALATLDTAVAPEVARAAQATENVWRQIDAEFGLLSSTEVAAVLGASKNNRAYAATLRKRGALGGIERKNAFVYPGFQLDTTTGTIRAWVAPLLQLAAQHQRSISDAFLWLIAPSTYFNGARPADHLDDAERLLSVAGRSWDIEW